MFPHGRTPAPVNPPRKRPESEGLAPKSPAYGNELEELREKVMEIEETIDANVKRTPSLSGTAKSAGSIRWKEPARHTACSWRISGKASLRSRRTGQSFPGIPRSGPRPVFTAGRSSVGHFQISSARRIAPPCQDPPTSLTPSERSSAGTSSVSSW